MGRMTSITGSERRRRRSFEERAWMLAAIEEPGAVVAEVARRADVCTSLVYKWRREARSAASASSFAPVIVEHTPQSPSPASEPEPGAIIVEMNGARKTGRVALSSDKRPPRGRSRVSEATPLRRRAAPPRRGLSVRTVVRRRLRLRGLRRRSLVVRRRRRVIPARQRWRQGRGHEAKAEHKSK